MHAEAADVVAAAFDLGDVDSGANRETSARNPDVGSRAGATACEPGRAMDRDPSPRAVPMDLDLRQLLPLVIIGGSFAFTGTILYGADGDFRAPIASLDDARSHLRRLHAVGALSVKSSNPPRREQRQQVLQAARELNKLVVPEGGSTF
jgi:hypothetical protein